MKRIYVEWTDHLGRHNGNIVSGRALWVYTAQDGWVAIQPEQVTRAEVRE